MTAFNDFRVPPLSSTTTTTLMQSRVQQSTHTVNTSPFFPEPSTLRPPPDPGQYHRTLARIILASLFSALALLIALLLILKRCRHLRRTNQPFSHFLWQRQPASSPNPPSSAQHLRGRRAPAYAADLSPYVLPYTPFPQNLHNTFDNDVRYPIPAASLHSLDSSSSPPYTICTTQTHPGSPTFLCPHQHPHQYPQPYPHPYPYLPYPPYPHSYLLPHLPPQNRQQLDTRAINTDEHGRRLDSGYHDPDFVYLRDGLEGFLAPQGGDSDDKDALPPYDRFGGPPMYVDVDVGTVVGPVRRPAASEEGMGERAGNDGNGEVSESQSDLQLRGGSGGGRDI